MSSIKLFWYCCECGQRHALGHLGVGLAYRTRMRIMHRLGWCFPQSVGVEPGLVWCHWCGMRGRR